MKRLAIIGGGAWGTALAIIARRTGAGVTLWTRDAAIVAAINRQHENPVYLPGITLDPEIAATVVDVVQDAVRPRQQEGPRLEAESAEEGDLRAPAQTKTVPVVVLGDDLRGRRDRGNGCRKCGGGAEGDVGLVPVLVSAERIDEAGLLAGAPA